MSHQDDQLSFLDEQSAADNTPVVCLGMTFENEEARRDYFREELRKKLPELKNIEGFPIGENEDIIALSDPPHYTACPNPWINDFIEEWEKEKVTKYGREINEDYHREPFTSDVSEGKKEPIYNLHSYHTKVPYKAIMKYILHYTNPGDIILDGFSGTGMTGFAAQKCCDKNLLKNMGFIVTENEEIIDVEGNKSKLGLRRSILNDLSPVATSITYNYNNVRNYDSFKKTGIYILENLQKEIGWMYETEHEIEGTVQIDSFGNPIKGRVNFTIWSDVFECPNCAEELVYWDHAIDSEKGQIKNEIHCPSCLAINNKNQLKRVWIEKYDQILQKAVTVAKQIPRIIDYSVGNQKFEKKPNLNDHELFKNIENLVLEEWIPIYELPEGYNTQQPKKSHGINFVHQFYTARNLYALTALKKLLSKVNHPILNFLFSSMLQRATQMNRIHIKNYFFRAGGYNAGYLKGTLYVSSLPIEMSILKQFEDRLKGFETGFRGVTNKAENTLISTGSSTDLNINDNSIDYIFTDPPFGGNIMYSELNFIWESWLKVFTNNRDEAIINPIQKKTILEYQNLISDCFSFYYKVLKPGRWITVEFSNSKASVWNAIQEAMQKAGFVIANVAALDKKHGSFKSLTSTTAVKQDLIISAYKPSIENIQKILEQKNTPESAWTFVAQHLEMLSVFSGSKGEASIIAERTPRILFDRMIAYHVQNGHPVPISSAEFQAFVAQRFPMRDGMAFLESQVAEYDKKRILVKEFSQMSLFVSDENSAIEWLRQQLMKKPQTSQDLHPQFMKEIQHIAKHEQLPELSYLLQQNFLRYEGDEIVPDQIGSYLRRNYHDFRGLENSDEKMKDKALNRWYVPDPNKQADLEKLREKSLLREFDSYIEELITHKKNLKQFRTEAIRAGFKKAWSDKDYKKIVAIGDRLPESVIQEDDKLLMYYDNAQIRLDM